jgi:hypothetical protein
MGDGLVPRTANATQFSGRYSARSKDLVISSWGLRGFFVAVVWRLNEGSLGALETRRTITKSTD